MKKLIAILAVVLAAPVVFAADPAPATAATTAPAAATVTPAPAAAATPAKAPTQKDSATKVSAKKHHHKHHAKTVAAVQPAAHAEPAAK